MDQTKLISRLKKALAGSLAVLVLGCSSLGYLLYQETEEVATLERHHAVTETQLSDALGECAALKITIDEQSEEIESLESALAAATTVSSNSYGSSTSSSGQTQSVTVYVTKTGSKYHKSGCQYLSQSKIAISLSKAKSSGYSACSRCY